MKKVKYFCSFTITPDREKITLGYNNFGELLKEKIAIFEFHYGKIENLKIKKEEK